MNAETFCEHFATFAEAPNCVAKLRTMILQLAVQGKLVPQDPNDEPATLHSKAGEARKPPAIADEDEQSVRWPFEIPSHWRWIRLRDTPVELKYGTSVKCDYGGNGVPVLRIPNVVAGRIEIEDMKYGKLTDKEQNELRLEEGNLLVIRSNGSTGIVGRTAVVDRMAVGFAYAGYLVRLRFATSTWLPEFLHLAMISPATRDQIEGPIRTTSGVKNINSTEIGRLMLPLPPLAEQKRIVEKVDQLMAMCDELAARQAERTEGRKRVVAATLDRLVSPSSAEALPAHANRVRDHFDRLFDTPTTIPQLRQAILKLAVQGQLVPQDLNEKPISELLDSISKARREFEEHTSARQRSELISIEYDEPMFEMPANWRWIRFGELANIVGGVTLGRKLDGREVESFPYLRVANVQQGWLDLSVIKDVPIPIDELPKYQLRRGDVLLTEGGDWDKLGRSAIWRDEIKTCLHQNHIFRARLFSTGIRPEWITLFTNSPVGRSFFQNASKQTTNLASINMTQLRNCPVPIPSTAAQDRILSKVNELMSLCGALEAKLTQAETASTQLLSAAVSHLLNQTLSS